MDFFVLCTIPEFRNDSSLYKERGMDLNTSDTVDVFYGNSNLLSDGSYVDRIFNIKDREATAKGYIYTLRRIGTIDFFCIAFQNSGGARFSLVTYDGKKRVFHILPYFFEKTNFFKQYAFVEDEKFIVQLYYERIDAGKSVSEESKLHLREYRRVTEVSDSGEFVLISENVTVGFFNYLQKENRIEYLLNVKK
jgi:hypothetical protein